MATRISSGVTMMTFLLIVKVTPMKDHDDLVDNDGRLPETYKD